MVKRLPGRKLDRGAQTTDEYWGSIPLLVTNGLKHEGRNTTREPHGVDLRKRGYVHDTTLEIAG